jgi:hypothetical protein
MAFLWPKDRFRDLRKSPRFEVDYLAQIDAGSDAPLVNCVICDISASGAKLTVGVHEVPDEFVLLFRRRCHVINRFDGQVGVQFKKT